jgi:hypothetical protein
MCFARQRRHFVEIARASNSANAGRSGSAEEFGPNALTDRLALLLSVSHADTDRLLAGGEVAVYNILQAVGRRNGAHTFFSESSFVEHRR